MQEQVHMRIDQAGHQSRFANIQHLRARRMRHRCGGLHDLFAFDEHFTRTQQAATFDIEQMRGVQNDRLRMSHWQKRRQHEEKSWESH
jgi:hypothetical protein